MDIMIPPEISEALKSQGYDVLEARELPSEIYQDDRLLLEEAARQGRVLVTCNYSDPQSNFIIIHEEWQREGAREDYSRPAVSNQPQDEEVGGKG